MAIRAVEGLDAHFSLEAVDENLHLIFESRSGSGAQARNADYAEALELILSRLATRGGRIMDALVDSAATRRLSKARRRLGLSFPISINDPRELRRRLSQAQARVGREPGAKGNGNPTKKIRLILGFDGQRPQQQTLEEHLQGGATPPSTPPKGDLVSAPSPRSWIISLRAGKGGSRLGAFGTFSNEVRGQPTINGRHRLQAKWFGKSPQTSPVPGEMLAFHWGARAKAPQGPGIYAVGILVSYKRIDAASQNFTVDFDLSMLDKFQTMPVLYKSNRKAFVDIGIKQGPVAAWYAVSANQWRALFRPGARLTHPARIPPKREPSEFDPSAVPKAGTSTTSLASPEETQALKDTANQEHHRLLVALDGALRGAGWREVQEIKSAIDLWAIQPQAKGTARVIFEAKTLIDEHDVGQTRAALAQLLEYRLLFGRPSDKLVLLANRRVADGRVDILESFGIAVVWHDGQTFRGRGELASPLLGSLLQSVD